MAYRHYVPASQRPTYRAPQPPLDLAAVEYALASGIVPDLETARQMMACIRELETAIRMSVRRVEVFDV